MVNIWKERNVRNLTKAFAAVSLLAPVTSYSLGVGSIRLHSSLNQKFRAEIPLIVSAAERKNFKSIKVRLAPPGKFDAAGIKWNYFLSKIRFRTRKKSNGSVVIQLSSSAPLKEPFLDFLIQVNSPSGKIYREFTVLIDPPKTYAKAPKKTQYVAPTPKYTPAPRSSRAIKQSFVAENRNGLTVKDLSKTKKNSRVSTRSKSLQIIDKDGAIRETAVATKQKTPKKYKERVHKKYTPKKNKPKTAKKYTPRKNKPKIAKKYTPRKNKPKTAKKYTPKQHKTKIAKKYIPRKNKPKTSKKYTPKQYKTKVAKKYTPKKYKKKIVRHNKRIAKKTYRARNNAPTFTRRNTTLSYIASRTNRYRNVSAKQMMLALYEANPHAFYKPNINALEVGKKLTIPSREAILRISRRQAIAEFQRHENEWKGIVTPQAPTPRAPIRKKSAPHLVLKAPDEAEISDQAEIAPSIRTEPSSEAAKKLKDSNQDLKIRLEKLQKQLEGIQQIIVLKDKELALLKKSLTLKDSKQDKKEQQRIENELKETDDAIKASAIKLAEEKAKKLEADKVKTLAADEAAKKLEADKVKTLAADEAAKKLEADKAKTLSADEEAKKLEADKAKTLAADEEAKKLEADKAKTLAADEAAKKLEADKAKTLAADEEAKKLEADKAKTLAADEEAKKLEADKAKTLAADEEAKKLEAEQTTDVIGTENSDLISETVADLGVPDNSENKLLELELKEPKSSEDIKEIERLKKLNPSSPDEDFDFTPELPDNFSLSTILEDSYYQKLAGGGSIFLLLFAWLFLRRRKIQETTEVESMFTESSEIHLPNDDDEFKVESLDNNSFLFGGESSFLNNDSDFDAFDDDKDDIDSISEADVYLAYGRYQQAEELMRQAIEDQPNRDECKLKLLEILVANEDKEGFEKYTQELADSGKNSDTIFWQKVIEMGQRIIPDSTLLEDKEAFSKNTDPNKSDEELGDDFKIEMPDFNDADDLESGKPKINLEKQAENLEKITSEKAPDNNIDFDLEGFDNTPLISNDTNKKDSDSHSVDFDLSNSSEKNDIDFNLESLSNETAFSSETKKPEEFENNFNLASFEQESTDSIAPNNLPNDKKGFDLASFDNDSTIFPPADEENISSFEIDKALDLPNFDEDIADSMMGDESQLLGKSELNLPNSDDAMLSSKIEDLGNLADTFDLDDLGDDSELLIKKDIDLPNIESTTSKIEAFDDLGGDFNLSGIETDVAESIVSGDSTLLGDSHFGDDISSNFNVDGDSELENNFDLSSFDDDVTHSILSGDSEVFNDDDFNFTNDSDELNNDFDLSNFDAAVADSLISNEAFLSSEKDTHVADIDEESSIISNHLNEQEIAEDSKNDLLNFDDESSMIAIDAEDERYVDDNFDLLSLDDESSIISSSVNGQGGIVDNDFYTKNSTTLEKNLDYSLENLDDESSIIAATMEDDFDLSSLDEESSIIATGVNEQGIVEDDQKEPSSDNIIKSATDELDIDFDLSSLDEESSIISTGISNQGLLDENFDFDLAGFEDLPAKAMSSTSNLDDYSAENQDHLLDSVENFDLSPTFDEEDLEDTKLSSFDSTVDKDTEPLGLNNAISLEDSSYYSEQDEREDFQNLDEMSVEETKIDLARAYIDMGDSAAAKSILEEIQEQGTEDQKLIAKKLLNSL